MSDDFSTVSDFLADPFGGQGQLIMNYPEKRVWVRSDEQGRPIESCTVHYIDPIIEQNKAEFNAAGSRWGEWAKVASIPMDRYFREINPRLKDGNDASVKRWLDNPDHRSFRTRPGRV